MNNVAVLVFSILLTQSFAQNTEVLPRKGNILSNYLNKTLNSLFEELATNNVSIKEIDLGEAGRIDDLEGCVLGEMKKQVDGFKNFGFDLKMELSEILVSGLYDIFLDLENLGLFPLFGKGNFSISVKKVSLNMRLNANFLAADEKFDIEILRFDLAVEKTLVKFENLMNDPSIADFLNKLFSNLIPNLVTIYAKPLIETLHPVIDFYGNGIIKCIKKELLTGKIDECIRNLFVKTPPKTLSPQTGSNLNLF